MGMRKFSAVILFLLVTTLCWGELILINPGADKILTELKVVYWHEIPYISILELADNYNLRTFHRAETGKFVVYFPAGNVKITANSPWIMMGLEVKHHMTSMAIASENNIYVPLHSFLDFMKATVAPKLKYSYSPDEKKNVLAPLPRTTYYASRKEEQRKKIRLTDVQYDEKRNGLMIAIGTTGAFRDADLSAFLKDDHWLYLTLYGAVCDSTRLSAVNPTPSVARIEAINQAKSVQMSFKLHKKFISNEIHYDRRMGKITVALNLPLSRDLKQKIAEAKTAWQIDTIVLDPGHGGKDPGTPGRWGGQHEKDIVLDVVTRLGRLLKNEQDVKVVYTRDNDDFIPLWQRPEIANKSGGKLFLSFHVNACSNPRVNGIELYVLRPGKSEDAVRVAEQENSVIQLEAAADKQKYEGYDDISNILANMVHSANMHDSERLAEIMSLQISKKLPQKNRGVKQAGFYVLVGASMPKLLIELGYYTNRQEAKQLNRASYRQMIARTLYESLLEFKREADRSVLGS